jgi:hypothetical protein
MAPASNRGRRGNAVGGLESLEVVETDELRVGHLAEAFRASGISTPWSADGEPGQGQLLLSHFHQSATWVDRQGRGAGV